MGHIIYEGRFWIVAWGHFGRFGASKVTPKGDKNEVENEVEKRTSKKQKGAPERARTRRVDGMGGAPLSKKEEEREELED